MAMTPERLGRLVDERAAALTLFARQWCAAPEDVVQEAFVKLAARRPPPDDAVAWLYQVVRNGAISQGVEASERRSAAATRRAPPRAYRRGSPRRNTPRSTAKRPPPPWRRCRWRSARSWSPTCGAAYRSSRSAGSPAPRPAPPIVDISRLLPPCGKGCVCHARTPRPRAERSGRRPVRPPPGGAGHRPRPNPRRSPAVAAGVRAQGPGRKRPPPPPRPPPPSWPPC